MRRILGDSQLGPSKDLPQSEALALARDGISLAWDARTAARGRTSGMDRDVPAPRGIAVSDNESAA